MSEKGRAILGNWLVRDAMVLVALAVAAVLAGRFVAGTSPMVQAQVHHLLTLLAVAGTVAAAIMTGDRGPGRR